jgi:outer membrane lipoprotein-sorting protein
MTPPQSTATRTAHRLARGLFLLVIVLFASRAVPGQRVNGQQVNVDQLVQRSEDSLRGRTEQGKVSMTVHTPDWQRTLKMNYWAVNPDKTFIRVTAPARDAGTATLRIQTNMWNYLPSVERVIKIPPSLMLQAWLGSDFTNDDLVRESSLVKDYSHKLDGEKTIAGDPCYRVVSTPKPNAPVVWGRVVLFVRKKDALPRRQEYYDDRGTLKKVLVYEDFRVTGGRLYPMRWIMTSVTRPGHRTTLVFANLVFNRKIPASTFTRENLQQAF